MLVCQNLTQPSSFTRAWDRLCWDDSGERQSSSQHRRSYPVTICQVFFFHITPALVSSSSLPNTVKAFFGCATKEILHVTCATEWILLEAVAGLRMATGRVRIGWSLRAPKTETRNRNPNPKPIRVEIHHQNQTRGYPKPEWMPETRR